MRQKVISAIPGVNSHEQLLKRYPSLRKKKESCIAYTIPGWELRKHGIGVHHTCLWTIKGGENDTKVRITIQEE
jgi:hypothetical protein